MDTMCLSMLILPCQIFLHNMIRVKIKREQLFLMASKSFAKIFHILRIVYFPAEQDCTYFLRYSRVFDTERNGRPVYSNEDDFIMEWTGSQWIIYDPSGKEKSTLHSINQTNANYPENCMNWYRAVDPIRQKPDYKCLPVDCKDTPFPSRSPTSGSYYFRRCHCRKFGCLRKRSNSVRFLLIWESFV